MRTLRVGSIILSVSLLLAGILFMQGTASGQDLIDSTADGPHIYWQCDTSAVVIYLCNDSLIKQNVNFADTLRFSGLCRDKGVEYVIPAYPHQVRRHKFENVSKIITISDIHGEYEYFERILINGGVIDKNHHWIWGDGHLVINGDVFDRGDMVTECLWLIYGLAIEAEKYGGRVHFLLGNHELMVIRGDNRYIHDKYLKGIAKRSRIRHEDLFGPDMELGRWLRSLPTSIMINDILFVHGGLSPYLIDKGYDLGRLNKTVLKSLDLRSSQLAFDEESRFLFGSKGPFWYRGYHYEMENRYPMATTDDIDKILGHFGAKSVVVGHSELDRVTSLFDGRVFGIDVPVGELGGFQALLWEDSKFRIIDVDGSKLSVE